MEEKKSFHVVYLEDGKLTDDSSDSIRDIVDMLLETRPEQYFVYWGVRCHSLTRLFIAETRSDLHLETLHNLTAFEQGIEPENEPEQKTTKKKRRRKRKKKPDKQQ